MPTWVLRFLLNCDGASEEEKKKIRDIYYAEGRDAFYQFAQNKKILPFAANTFVRLGLEEEFWEQILGFYRERNTNILRVLDEAYVSMKKQGVKKVFLSENFGALLSADGDIGLFASGDVDNYADPSEKEKIYRAFEKIGYSRKERFSGRHQIAAEFFPPEGSEGLPEGFYISIDFYPLARLKLPCFIKADNFVDWDMVRCYKDTAIVLPPPTALMYICLLHISLHSFSRAPDIRLYVDLLNMTCARIDYERIEKWCREDHTCTRAATAADIGNTILGTKIPEQITNLSCRKEKVKKIVFDSKTKDLIYEPHGLTVLKIETACDDFSDVHGLVSILHPDRKWMKETYGSCGFVAHMKHFLRII